jgi:hypothetical protein
MGRMWAITLAIAFLGCRAPTPSFNVLAPYGSATVPPPATGSVGTGAGYYAPLGPGVPSPGPVTVPSSPSPVYGPQSPAVLPPASYLGGAQPTEATPSGSNATRASYDFVDTGPHELALSSSAQAGSSAMTELPHGGAADPASSLRLNGMRVSDATQAGEPREFLPPEEAVPMAGSPVGSVDRSPAFLRILNSRGASPAGTPTPALSESTASNGTWRSR